MTTDPAVTKVERRNGIKIKKGYTTASHDMMCEVAREKDEQFRIRSERINRILDAFEDITNDWDKMCDCDDTEGVHQKSCMTMNFRYDVEMIRKELEEER